MAGRKSAASAQDELSPVLVIGLANWPSENEEWVWGLLDQVEPQLKEWIQVTDPTLPIPEFRKATSRRHRLTAALPDRERVVLVTAAETGEQLTEISRWHCGPSRLRTIRQVAPASENPQVPVHPLLLEERLPSGGLDLLRLPSAPGPQMSSPMAAAHRDGLAASLLSILCGIMREVFAKQEVERSVA